MLLPTLIAMAALGQAPYVSPSILAVNSPNLLNLGQVDSGTPLLGHLVLLNVGGKPYKVFPPVNESVGRLKILYPENLEVLPGTSIDIPFEYDLHWDEGAAKVKVQVYTNDPGAKSVAETYTFTTTNSTYVRPFRSTVLGRFVREGDGDRPATPQPRPGEATTPVVEDPHPSGQVSVKSDPVEFEFQPRGTGEPFVGIQVLDPAAPLKGTFVSTPGGGVMGKIDIDTDKILVKGVSRRGETKILGITAKGVANYFWLQWNVE